MYHSLQYRLLSANLREAPSSVTYAAVESNSESSFISIKLVCAQSSRDPALLGVLSICERVGCVRMRIPARAQSEDIAFQLAKHNKSHRK